jgi:hypothetical protein
MKMKTLVTFAACLLFMPAAPNTVRAATTTYTDSTAYFAAAGPQTLQDFNSPPISTVPGTSIGYPNLVISCSGSVFCSPNTFRTTSSVSIDGLSIFSSSPSTITFTFNSPLTSFGIYVAGLGTNNPGSTDFSISNSNGFSTVLFSNYSGTTNDFNIFAGLISDTRFTSVSLMGTEIGDGMFFDNLSYGHSNKPFTGSQSALVLLDPLDPVPLPGALPLFASGLIGLGLLGWRRKRKAVAP